MIKKTHRNVLCFFASALLFSVLATLSACRSEVDSELPAAAARDWLKAANGIYTQVVVGLTCSDKVDELKASRETGADYIVVSKDLRSFSSQNDVDIAFDASGVEFNVLSIEAEEAIVEVKGDATVTVGEGSPSPVALDERWLMVVEEGEWKWCGYAE